MVLKVPLLWVTVGNVDVLVKMFWMFQYFLKSVLCSNTVPTCFLGGFFFNFESTFFSQKVHSLG